MRRIDWIAKLRHFLQIVAFALAIATIQYAFMPERPYGPPVVYSLLIATIAWAIIDLGRELFPSAAETGWPHGLQGLALVVGGNVVGYFAGTAIADALCVHYFRFYPPGAYGVGGPDMRTSVLITALAGIAGTYYFYTINKAAYLERKMSEARQHANEARLKLLETQLEPHMLFNTLANLRALIGTDAQRAQTMLDHMIAYLRATLSASRASAHPLQAEYDRLGDYLELMSIRMGPRLRYTLDLPAGLAAQPVPTLLLQPLVENSIKHGLEPKVEGGAIHVSARAEGATVVLEVSDTGVGPAGAQDGAPGFGLAQVRERLSTVYGDQATFSAAGSPGQGMQTVIRFPLARAGAAA